MYTFIYSPVVADRVKGTGKLGHISAAQQTAFLVKHIIKHGGIAEDRVGYVLPWSAAGVGTYTLGLLRISKES